MGTGLQRLERLSAPLPPRGEMGGHSGDKGCELWMLIDRRLDGRFLHGDVDVAGAPFLEQGVPELWADVPVPLERTDIADGNATL